MAQVKDLLVQGQAKFLRKAYFQDQIVSNVAQGTAPLVVASSTVVSNLNSDYLDGYHASGLFTALSANSTLSITIGGTTLTSSINAATVDGKYISNYYTKSEADNRFVNVTGDTMSGALIFSGVTGGNYNEGIRIQDASNKWAVITFGATGTTGCSPQSGEVAWVAAKEPGGKFLISPNTSSDTVGLRLEKDGNAYWRNSVILHSGNYTSYLGYIGTTAVQASSAAQALSGITSINSRLSINAESDNTRLGFGGVHGVTFGEPGYAHRTYYFRPAYGSNGVTYTSLIIQNASAAASPTFTTTHSFDYNGNAYHSGNIYLDTGDSDRFIQFRYNSNNYAGASWRLLSRGSGSGDTNYFDIETGGSSASNNTWYRVIRLTMDNRYVGIGTDLPTYKLHIAGDSYTTGWSRAANGFYVEGTGVHFTHHGNCGEIDMTSTNEFLWGSSSATLYFNYRAVSRGTTVNNYIWNAGSSTSWASHNMGNIWLNGSGVYLRLGPQNSSHAHYETTASVSHWFNKRVDVNGDIWRYNTNYGIASDGQFYAKAIYANRDGGSTYGGVSLYSTSDPITQYGIAFRGTGNYGKIGRVQGDWATYFTMDSLHNRGWIFRSGGTNYASVSARGEAYFNSVGTDNYIAYPSGGFFSSDGSKSGYIIITIPANYRSCTMMRFNVEIYNYSTGTSTTYTIGGYNYSDGNWYNVFAYANRQGTTGYGNLTVRFGHNGTNSIIWIGESNTSYSYPKVRITNVTLGNSNPDYNTWAAGWSVTIATTAPTNVSQTVTNPATNYYAESAGSAGNADTVDGQHLITQVSDWNTDSLSIFKSSENSISNAPTTDFIYGVTLRFHRSISIYHTDLVTSLYHDRLFFRRKTEEGYHTWRELIHSGNIGSQSVNYANSAGSVAWGNVTGKPFNWSGQSGQPTWLWGSNDGTNYYVWNPSNFSVNYANSAGNADTVDNMHASDFSYNVSSGNYDCNNLPYGTHSATYRFSGSPLNAFPNSSWSNMFVIGAGSDTMTQIGAPYGADELYFRRGTWYSDGGSIRTNAWNAILHSGNYTSYVNNYYWANVKISTSSNTGTYPTFANMKSTGRVYLDEWIQFSGSSGLYWPNTNGAHLYANTTTSYAALITQGSRGGYCGLQCGPSANYMTVMDNGSDKGLYNESNGRWIYYYSRTNDKVGILTSSLTKTINLSGQTYISTNTWIGTTSGSEMLNVGGWVGTTGAGGWYSLSYGGGIHMSDSTYVRVYNGKRFYNSNTEQYAFYTAGGITVGTHFWGTSGASTWLQGQRDERAVINITNKTDASSFWPIIRWESSSQGRWDTIGVLGNNLYFMSSVTSRTNNGYDTTAYIDMTTSVMFSNGFYHMGIGSNDYVLLAGGSYKRISDFFTVSTTSGSSVSSLYCGSYSAIYIARSSSQTMSFASTPAEGKECHIVIYNSGSSNITITLPSSYRKNITSITIAPQAFGEVNVMTINSIVHVRAV